MRKVVAVIAVLLIVSVIAFSWPDSEILFEKQLSKEHRLTIRGVAAPRPDVVTLRITYHNRPAFGTVIVADQTVRSVASPITFTSITDLPTGVVCVFDNHDLGFLLMYDPRTDDLWDSTGRAGGWHGSARSEWQGLLTQLRSRHVTIPYLQLPGGAVGRSQQPTVKSRSDDRLINFAATCRRSAASRIHRSTSSD